MNILNVEGVSKNFGDTPLFEQISLGISDTDKIGIVGVNGTGKTTLLKIIAGLEEPDEGKVIQASDARITYLPQSPDFAEEDTIVSYVMDGGVHGEEWEKESDAKTILTRLGITEFDQQIAHLSGGQKKRIALAKTLIHPADVLILDEPTNHLDSAMVEWLEEFLKSWRGVLIMVTHDRYFLDSVTNKIVEIDNHTLYSYQANYSGYLELKSEREEMARSTFAKQQNLLRNELKWVRRGAQARSTKQKARLNRFEELTQIKGPRSQENVQLESVATRMGKKTIEVHDVSLKYGDREMINHFEYIFLRNDRIGIIGQNGCGKTTLLKIINGILEPDSGYVEMGPTIQIGYFSQENEFLNPNQRVIDVVKDIAEYLPIPGGRITASQMLERFLFTKEMQYTYVEKLSGGEKRRLYLLQVLMSAPNVLILDEPTNDLDITTLAVLEDYLDEFDGIVIVVSHDRYFLDRVVDRIFAFAEDGILKQYEGGYTDYYLKRQQELAASQTTIEMKKEKTEKPKSKKLKFSFNEQREFDTIDEDIAALEEKIASIEQEMEEKSNQYMLLEELTAQKEEAEAALEEKMDRWVYLNDLAEQIEAQNYVLGKVKE